MKTYQTPEIAFEGIAPADDVLTTSTGVSLFSNVTGSDRENTLDWGQI